nr:hypothetical protein [Tanacetum cinerariifolium]
VYTHDVYTHEGLRGSRKLKLGALSLYVGNGQRAAIEAIGSYHLSLLNGLVIVLNNRNYAPSNTRGIISVSRLYDDRHVNRFVDNSIQVSKNNMVYFSVVPRNGIFEIDLSDSYTNVSSIYALSNKRSKSNLDSALLWHCRLGHINKKRIEKLQHDGFLNSNDLRAFEKCALLHEQTHPNQNALALHVIRAGKVHKKKNKQKPRFRARGQYQGKGKNKHAYDPKPKISPPSKKKIPAKDTMCHQCGDTCHWKRNYPQNIAELLKNLKLSQGASGKVHKKKNKQKPGFRARGQYQGKGNNKHACDPKPKISPPSKKKIPAKDTMCHQCGDTGAAIEAIGSYHLSLLNGLVIVLNNRNYAPSNTRGIISVSRLYDDRHVNRFIDNSIQVSKNNMVYFSAVPRDGIFEIDLSDSYTNVSSIYALSNKRSKSNLDSALLWHCRLGHINKKRIKKLQHDGFLNSNDLRAFEKCALRDTLTKPDKLEPGFIKCIFVGYLKETMGYSFYYPLENKVLVARNAKFLKNSLVTQKASRSLEDLEIIQKEDAHPSIYTSLNHEEDDLKVNEPQSDIIPICRDLGEPANYKVALLDHGSDKWLNAMNVEMQSMKDKKVWDLARLVAKGYTQTPRIDYEETFSPIADIRAIRILIAIIALYDYEIWQMDVKTAFLNGYLSKEVYMEKPEGDLYWTTIKNILKYLRNTKDMFLVYGGVVNWKSAKQIIFATSSVEAEYIVAFDASKEVVWVRKFISGLGVVPTIKEPISMYCDNTGAITIANVSGITKGARHFRAKFNTFVNLLNMVT